MFYIENASDASRRDIAGISKTRTNQNQPGVYSYNYGREHFIPPLSGCCLPQDVSMPIASDPCAIGRA